VKNFIKNILLLGVLGLFIFYFQDPLNNAFDIVKNKYFPCKSPIVYSLGSFDDRFNLSKNDFIKHLEKAEKKWEDALGGKDLFVYQETGGVQVNLIYDSKQMVTEKLNDLGSTLDKNRASYEAFKVAYKDLLNDYQKLKNTYEARVLSFNDRSKKYTEEVKYWNDKGGANDKAYASLNQEREWLNNESDTLESLHQSLNSKITTINKTVNELNLMAKNMNLDVAVFNKIGEENSGEFEEGLYRTGPEGKFIDIYQFDNKIKLERVLAHEFGHALGLAHVNDKEAIMYELNSSTNTKLTETDLLELSRVCSSK